MKRRDTAIRTGTKALLRRVMYAERAWNDNLENSHRSG